MDFFLQLLINGVSIGFLYGLSAMGFVMIFKSSSVLNFAHGEILAFGAFLFLALVTWAKLPVALAFVVTLAGAFVMGFVIERIFLRPLIGEPLIQVIMLTVGLAAMFKGGMLLVWGGNLYNYPEFLPAWLGIEWGIVQVPPSTWRPSSSAACFCCCSACFSSSPRRASTCAPWRTTSRRRSPSGSTSGACSPFPGASRPWWRASAGS